MHKALLTALAAITTLTFTACVDGVYYSSGTYSTGPAYYDDGYGYDYYQEPVFIQRDYIYIDDRPLYVPIYRYRDDVYYVYGGQRYNVNTAQRSKYNAALAEYKNKRLIAENRAKIQRAENQQKIDQYRAEQAWKQRQAEYRAEQQRKQWEYERKVAANRAAAQQAVYRNQLEQKKREWEYAQKQKEYENRVAIAKWKAQNPQSSKKDDDKKKKKD